MAKKYFKGTVGLKADAKDEGMVSGVFATLNTIDLDGDVTLPGAFGDQPVKIAAWGHNWGALPVGRGEISESGDDAVFESQFFLDTESGREHFTVVKNLGELQEWSYGFEVLEAETGEFEGQPVRFLKKLKVFEVSPVMRGAGVDTRTTDVKNDNERPYVDQAEAALAAVEAVVERTEALADLRAKEGRTLSAANRGRLSRLLGLLDEVRKDIKELLDSTEPPEKAHVVLLEAQRVLFEAERRRTA